MCVEEEDAAAVVEVAGVETAGSCELVVQRLEAAGRGRHQQMVMKAAVAVAVVEVAGVGAAGSWWCRNWRPAAGRGKHQQGEVEAAEAAALVQ